MFCPIGWLLKSTTATVLPYPLVNHTRPVWKSTSNQCNVSTSCNWWNTMKHDETLQGLISPAAKTRLHRSQQWPHRPTKRRLGDWFWAYSIPAKKEFCCTNTALTKEHWIMVRLTFDRPSDGYGLVKNMVLVKTREDEKYVHIRSRLFCSW